MLLLLKTVVDGWLFCGLKAENFQVLEEAQFTVYINYDVGGVMFQTKVT